MPPGTRRVVLFLLPSSTPQHQAISTCWDALERTNRQETKWSLSSQKIVQHQSIEIKVTLSSVLLTQQHFPLLLGIQSVIQPIPSWVVVASFVTLSQGLQATLSMCT